MLRIQGTNLVVSGTLREHVERRLGFALDRIIHHVRDIVVSLGDVNGPRGGADKRCNLLVTLATGKTLVIHETDSDLYRAIDRAAGRAKNQVKRRAARRRQSRRRRARTP